MRLRPRLPLVLTLMPLSLFLAGCTGATPETAEATTPPSGDLASGSLEAGGRANRTELHVRNATFYLTESSKHTGTAYQAGPEVVLPEGRILNATVTATWVPTLPTADRLTVQLQTESRPSPTLAEATGESPLVFAVPGEVFVHRTQIGYGAQNDGSMDSIILHQEVTFRFEFLVEAPPPEATTP